MSYFCRIKFDIYLFENSLSCVCVGEFDNRINDFSLSGAKLLQSIVQCHSSL